MKNAYQFEKLMVMYEGYDYFVDQHVLGVSYRVKFIFTFHVNAVCICKL